jgi:hypothetical protein
MPSFLFNFYGRKGFPPFITGRKNILRRKAENLFLFFIFRQEELRVFPAEKNKSVFAFF